MWKTVVILVLSSAMIDLLSSVEAPPAKKTSFSLGVSGLAVKPDTGDARGLVGPAAAVPFSLGKSLFVAPELAGGLLDFYSESQDVQGDGMLKVQLGTHGADGHFVVACVSNGPRGAWLNGVQVTVGYIF